MKTQKDDRKIFILVIAFVLFIIWLITATANCEEIELTWDANTEADLAGYKIYYGTATATYGSPIDVGNVTQHIIPGLQIGQKYFFAATAYDTAGNESKFSRELQYTIIDLPPDIVQGFKIVPANITLLFGQ